MQELGARHVLDVGCGTGTLACRLARTGLEVTGVDPAAASGDAARAKPGAERVRWVVGTAEDLPHLTADVVVMTANVVQVFLGDQEWHATLRAVHGALRPGGHLVFESRDPAREAWRGWTPGASRSTAAEPEVVEAWCEVTDVDGELVSFRWTHVFAADGAVVTSDSTLRFRGQADLSASLRGTGFEVLEVRDAPDRPGRELVFLARRTP